MNTSNALMTFDEKLKDAESRPSGFDYMRIALAFLVIFFHCFSMTKTPDIFGYNLIYETPVRSIYKLVVPFFFILSGFLVAGSMERCRTLVSFMGLRAIRIYPALVVEVLISALLIGPFITTVPLGAYFTDPKFFHYLMNVTGHPSYYLPGVFEDAKNGGIVNGQLWTVPLELLCYITLAVLWMMGIKRYRALVWIISLGMATALSIVAVMHGSHYGINHVKSYSLIIYFLAGLGMYLYKEKVRWDARLFWLNLIVAIVLIGYAPLGDYLAILPAAYATIFLGLCNPRRLMFIGGADYSYGAYLYGSVILQLFASDILAKPTWYELLLISAVPIVLVAMFSWHFIEKPMMKHKKGVYRLEDRWIATMDRSRGKLSLSEAGD